MGLNLIQDFARCSHLICKCATHHFYRVNMIFKIALLLYWLSRKPVLYGNDTSQQNLWFEFSQMTISIYFFSYFKINYLKPFLMLCTYIFCILCTLCSTPLLSWYQDWVFIVMIGVLSPFLIFKHFPINYLTSFKLPNLHENLPKASLKYVLFIT